MGKVFQAARPRHENSVCSAVQARWFCFLLNVFPQLSSESDQTEAPNAGLQVGGFLVVQTFDFDNCHDFDMDVKNVQYSVAKAFSLTSN